MAPGIINIIIVIIIVTIVIIIVIIIAITIMIIITLQRQVGLKKGNDWRVLRAAWHFVTVGVEQVTRGRSNHYYSFPVLVFFLNNVDSSGYVCL